MRKSLTFFPRERPPRRKSYTLTETQSLASYPSLSKLHDYVRGFQPTNSEGTKYIAYNGKKRDVFGI